MQNKFPSNAWELWIGYSEHNNYWQHVLGRSYLIRPTGSLTQINNTFVFCLCINKVIFFGRYYREHIHTDTLLLDIESKFTKIWPAKSKIWPFSKKVIYSKDKMLDFEQSERLLTYFITPDTYIYKL